MIEINATLMVLLFEAFICLVVLVMILIFVNGKKKNQEHRAAGNLIRKIKKSTVERKENMSDLVATHCAIEPEMQQQLLEEISTQERKLYQQIITLFLQKDVATLNKIDNCIRGLSEPYSKILVTNAKHDTTAVSTAELTEAQLKNTQLQETCKRLSQQLSTALNSIDEISSEYTRIFNGKKSEIELQNSYKKMLKMYREAESQVKNSLLDQGIKQL